MGGELESLRSFIVVTIEPSKRQPLRSTIEAGLQCHLAGIKGCVAWPFTLAGKDRPLGCSSQAENARENITLTLKIKVEKKTESLSRCFVSQELKKKVLYLYIIYIPVIC